MRGSRRRSTSPCSTSRTQSGVTKTAKVPQSSDARSTVLVRFVRAANWSRENAGETTRIASSTRLSSLSGTPEAQTRGRTSVARRLCVRLVTSTSIGPSRPAASLPATRLISWEAGPAARQRAPDAQQARARGSPALPALSRSSSSPSTRLSSRGSSGGASVSRRTTGGMRQY